MATAAQIKALIKSHIEGNDERFVSVGMQLAAHAARRGHGKLAQDLRDLVDEAKLRAAQTKKEPIPIAAPRGNLEGLLSVSYPKARLGEMVLHQELRSRLEKILLEQRSQSKLESHGLRPRRKLLLLGPPGTGKTMTAAVLAGELHLPLYVIVLDRLITKFMGETAAKLRLVFEAVSAHRGVFLFDEFDALGTERAASNDVGEIRRVLNSFLQFLEQDDSTSMLVAATNHPQTLDRALFRRFDDIIEYGVPNAALAERALRDRLVAFDTQKINWKEAARAANDLSYAEIGRACEEAAKEAVLNNSTRITSDNLNTALTERRAMRKE